MFFCTLLDKFLAMDDKIYNQIFLKPRFQIDFKMNATVLVSKVEELLKEEKNYRTKIVDNHLVIDVSEKDEHFWSPQLHVEVEPMEEDASKLKGLFGPKPGVWSLFMFIHFGVATAFIIFGIIAYSNWSLDKDVFFSIVMLIVLPIVWVTLYFLGRLGKSTGQKQMDELKAFTLQLLKKVTD